MRRSLLLNLALLVVASAALGAGTPIAMPPVGPSPHYVGSGSTAFAGGRFLTVWQEYIHEPRQSITHIYGALQDAEGDLIVPQAFPVVIDADVSGLALVGTENRFAMFWNRGDGTEMLLSFIDRNGTPAPPIELDIPSGSFLRDAQWNGSHFAIAYRESVDADVIHAAIVDGSGTVVNRFRLAEGAVMYPQIVPESGAFVILVATNDGDLTAHRISPDGALTSAFITSMELPAFTGLATAEGVRVTWTSRDPTKPAGSFQQVMFRADGALTERASFYIPLAGRIDNVRAVKTSQGDYLFASIRYAKSQLLAIELENGMPSSHSLVSGAGDAEPAAIAGENVLALSRDSSYQVVSVVIRGFTAGSPQLLSLSPAEQSHVLLAPLGGRFLVAWTERQGDTQTSKVALIDRAGRRLSSLVALDTGALAIASSGSGAVLLRPSGPSMIASWFDAAGRLIGESIVDDEWQGEPPAITWAGTHYVIAWPEGDSIAVATLTAPRAPASVRLVSMESPRWSHLFGTHFYGEVALAFDGQNVLLVALEFLAGQWPFDPPADSVALAVRLDRNGTPLAGNWTILDRQRPEGLSVASNGLQVAVVTWNAHSVVRAFTVPRDGPPDSEYSVVVFEAPRDVSAAVTWTGRDYAVVVSHEAFETRLAVKYYSTTLSQTRPAQTTETDSWIERPAVSASATGALIISGAELQQRRVKLAVTYQAEEMRELRNPPAPPKDIAVSWLEPYRAIVTWHAPAGPESFDGYVIRFRPPISQQNAHLVAPDARSATTTVYPPSMRIMVRAFNEAGLSPAIWQPERPRAVSR